VARATGRLAPLRYVPAFHPVEADHSPQEEPSRNRLCCGSAWRSSPWRPARMLCRPMTPDRSKARCGRCWAASRSAGLRRIVA